MNRLYGRDGALVVANSNHPPLPPCVTCGGETTVPGDPFGDYPEGRSHRSCHSALVLAAAIRPHLEARLEGAAHVS